MKLPGPTTRSSPRHALLVLAAACLLLGGCEGIREDYNKFSAPDEDPSLHFNQASRGFIHSPYAPEEGLVDVRRFAPGDEVMCPYTHRLFIVPARDVLTGIPLRYSYPNES